MWTQIGKAAVTVTKVVGTAIVAEVLLSRILGTRRSPKQEASEILYRRAMESVADSHLEAYAAASSHKLDQMDKAAEEVIEEAVKAKEKAEEEAEEEAEAKRMAEEEAAKDASLTKDQVKAVAKAIQALAATPSKKQAVA